MFGQSKWRVGLPTDQQLQPHKIMPVLQVQDEFQSGDNVTATNLNDLVNEASFSSGAVDNSTLQVASAGHLKVKDNGILSNHLKSDASNDSVRAVTTNHIRNDAVTNSKIADLAVGTNQIANDAVTYAKMQDVSATNLVLGRNSTGAGIVEEITPTALRTMINVEDGATADQTASEIKTAYESNGDTNAFTDADVTKLSGIEDGATADQTASEIKTAYESNSDTNAFTDADVTKLSGIEAGAEVNVQSDWTATSGDAFIENKPTIPTDNTELTNGAGYTTNTGTVTSVTGSGGISGTVTTSGSLSLSNSGVTTAKLADNAVTSAKISSTDSSFNIDSNGYVRIGTTATPSSLLTVNGTVEILKDRQSGTPEGGQIVLRAQDNTQERFVIDNYGVSDSIYRIYTTDDAGTQTGVDRFNIKGSNGNVGINESDPQYKLDVDGDINITGDFRKNGNIFGGSTYDSGWFSDPSFTSGNGGLNANTKYTFAHGLSSSNLIVIVYVARNSSGLSQTRLGDNGAHVGVDSTNIEVLLGSGPYSDVNNVNRSFGSGSITVNWAYLKVIAFAY